MNLDQERADYENHTWDYYQRLKTAGWSHSDEGDSSSREALFWRASNGQYGVRQLEAAWQGWLMRAALVPQVTSQDVARLDWLDKERVAYGLHDVHEGNRWMIDGAYANVREAIDAERSAQAE